jgi:hypothetical protein
VLSCFNGLPSFAAELAFQLCVNTKEFHDCQWNVCVVNDTVEFVGSLADGKEWNECARVVAACP